MTSAARCATHAGDTARLICPRAGRGDVRARATARVLLLASLLLGALGWTPSASAGVAFERTYEDPVGDHAVAGTDIVRFTSSVAEGVVTQRVEMAGPPDALRDTLIVRSWFHDSRNGSFHTVDLEVHARAEPSEKLRALVRNGSFDDTTPLAASWTIEGNAWVFTFSEETVQDATCFDPIVWAQHEPDEGSWSNDVGGIGTRYCRVRGDPAPSPQAPMQSEAPERTPPGPTPAERVPLPAPPGSDVPRGVPWVAFGALAAALILMRRTWRRS